MGGNLAASFVKTSPERRCKAKERGIPACVEAGEMVERRAMRFFVLVLLFGFVPCLAWAAPEVLDPPPPLAEEQTLSVYRGESAVITLRARGRESRQARFLLRSRPKSGRLGEISPTAPGTASVLYQAGADTGVDEFSFAVQSPGSPVSAAAKVRIYVVERPPQLEVPGVVDLGEFQAGEARIVTVGIANSGGGVLRGRLEAEGDWKLTGPAEFAIAGGDELRVPLEFHPHEERDYSGSLRVLAGEPRVVTLRARAKQGWRVRPPELEFSAEETGGVQKVEIVNQLDRPLTVEVSKGEGVELPASVEVPASGELSFPVRRLPDFVQGAAGELVLSSEAGEARIPYRIFPSPAKLEIAPEEGLDFRQEGGDGQRVRLANRGGLPVEVRFEVPEFLRTDAEQPVVLGVGEEREVVFRIRSRTGLRAGDGVVFSTPGEHVVLPLLLPEPDEAVESAVLVRSDLEGVGVPKKPTERMSPWKEPAAAPPAFKKIELVRKDRHSLVFSFEDPTPGVTRHRLEKREISPGSEGMPEIEWREFVPSLEEELTEGRKQFLLEGLPAGARLHLRIVSEGGNGKVLAQSNGFSLETTAPPAGWGPSLTTWVFLLAVGSALALVIHRHRRGVREAQAEDRRRIAALEAK